MLAAASTLRFVMSTLPLLMTIVERPVPPEATEIWVSRMSVMYSSLVSSNITVKPGMKVRMKIFPKKSTFP